MVRHYTVRKDIVVWITCKFPSSNERTKPRIFFQNGERKERRSSILSNRGLRTVHGSDNWTTICKILINPKSSYEVLMNDTLVVVLRNVAQSHLKVCLCLPLKWPDFLRDETSNFVSQVKSVSIASTCAPTESGYPVGYAWTNWNNSC